MITRLKTFEVSCDLPKCRRKKIVTAVFEQLPEGWTRVTTHGHGMTDYSKNEIRCPEHKGR